MRFKSSQELKNWPSRAVTLIGMSGVGKTTIASVLQQADWFQYSADYRIGTRYMGEAIVDNVKREAMKVPFLRNLLRSDSIFIGSNIGFNNLSLLSTYLGKPGNPALGGIPFAEYKRRQAQHREAEMAALLDVPVFIERAQTIYGYQHFICDTGGSICEVVNVNDPQDTVLNCLADHSLVLYIEGSEAHRRTLVERFRKAPKPMYYQPDFLDEAWASYKVNNKITADDAVVPDDFAVWGFEQLLQHRVPFYRAIADRYGYTVSMEQAAQVHNEESFLDLIARTIDGQS